MDARFPALQTEFTELLQFPGVLQAHVGRSGRRCRPRRWRCSTQVLDEFVAAREREGAKLAAVINERVDGIAAHRRAKCAR